ncbi:MAG: hypothetical protein FWE63_07700 [Bacteroidales bacterium]|nr:hypothetical protein [Bacteroidales bacterium]
MFLLLIVCSTTTLFAKNKDVHIKTQYKKGLFETEATILLTVSPKIMSEIILDIDYYLRSLEIDSLEWATKELSGKNEGKSLMQIEYSRGEYDENTEVFNFFLDVYFMKRRFKNIKISALMKTDYTPNGHPIIDVSLYEPNFFIKRFDGTLTMRQTSGQKQFIVKSSVSFGWFFNLFISTSNYSAIVEWRIQQFLENLKTEAEQR